MKTFTVDCSQIHSLSDFGFETIFILRQLLDVKVSRADIEKEKKEKSEDNLDSIADYIGNMFPPETDVLLELVHSDHLRTVLGYDATVEKKKSILEQYRQNYPEDLLGAQTMQQQLRLAEAHKGPTIFDEILAIIEQNPRIHLRLE